MQFGKDFDHWPTISGGPMVKILGGGGPKDTLALPLKFLGPPPPPVLPTLSTCPGVRLLLIKITAMGLKHIL